MFAVLVLAAACSGGGDGTVPAPTSGLPPVTTQSTVIPATTTAPPTIPTTTLIAPTTSRSACDSAGFAHNAARSDAIPDQVVVLDAVRFAGHDCYDRAVFEFRGLELPEFLVEESVPPFAGPSGRAVNVRGAAWLRVRFATAYAHTVEGQITVSQQPVLPIGFAALAQIQQIEDFEAVVVYVLGLDSARLFRVFTFLDPPRVVVDLYTG